jgi:hypothetical protein
MASDKGECASPILWDLINLFLLTVLGEKFDCIILFSVSGAAEHVIPGDSFVYDTTTGMTNDDTTMDPVPVEVSDLTQSEEFI